MSFGQDLAYGMCAGFGTKADIIGLAIIWYIGMPFIGFMMYLKNMYSYEIVFWIAGGYVIASLFVGFIIFLCFDISKPKVKP